MLSLPFEPRRSLGQNFLHDPNIIRKIVGSIGAPLGAPVVEIGPGLGALTGEIVEKWPRSTVIEVDERSISYLRGRFPDLHIIHEDVRKISWKSLADAENERLYLVGNLPYNLTSPILFSILDSPAAIHRAVFMMQREVAERIVAKPGNKTYGILSVLLQLYANVQILFSVSPNVFRPRPKVWSAVVGFDILAPESIPGVDFSHLKTIVKAAFGQRRKTLHNSLGNFEGLPEQFSGLRAEALTPENFVLLAKVLRRKL